MGDYAQGIQWGAEAVALWRDLGDSWQTAFALCMVGINAGSQGDAHRSAELLDEGLLLANDTGDPWLIALVLGRLAVTLLLLDLDRSRECAERSLDRARPLGDCWITGTALNTLGYVESDRGNFARAHDLWTEMLQLAQTNGERRHMTGALLNLSAVLAEQHDYVQAQNLLEQALDLAREIGERRQSAQILTAMGEIQRLQRNDVQASLYYQEALVLFRSIGDKWGVAWMFHNLGHVALHQDNVVGATDSFKESLNLFREIGYEFGTVNCLAGFAAVLAAQGHSKQAARLLGTVASLLGSMDMQLDTPDKAEYEHNLAATRSQIDAVTFDAAWAEGQALTLEQALAEALSLRVSE